MKPQGAPPVAILSLGLVLAAVVGSAETTQCTPITSLPYVITVQGIYCLTGDLSTAMGSGNAIEVQTNNVVIDLNGHKLGGLAAGPGTFTIGVYAAQQDNVTVKNGTIRGFYSGITLNQGQAMVIEGVRADQNTHTGFVAHGTACLLRNNQVVATGGTTVLGPNSDAYGILVNGASNRVLRNDVITVTKQGSGNAYGIYLTAGNNNLAVRNRITQADHAIYFDSPTGGKYQGNLSSGMSGLPYGGGTDAGNNN